ncbi:MAG: hypothetical protein SFW63_08890 [Alphaproteobacteria bacterium]|nr:hypothetical protein [Alphaproteobacteria bacterium]
MMRRLPFRFSLLVSVAGVMALSGCNTSNLADRLSGREGRKEQVVDGPRRAPLLNPQGGAMPGNQPPVNMPAAAQPAPAAAPAATAAAADNPFDQYDERGRKVAAAPAKPIEMTGGDGDEPGTVSSSFFDRFIPDRASDVPAAQPAAERKQERKPFSGNVPSVMEMEKAAPQPEPVVLAKSETLPANIAAPTVSDAAQIAEFKPVPATQNTASATVKAESVKPAVEEDAVGGFVPLLPPVTAAVNTPPAAASELQVQPTQPAHEKAALASSAADDASASEPSMISRLFSSLAGNPQPAPQTEEAEPFPELSSVPQVPKEFEKAKSDQKDQLTTLKTDHAHAKKQKEDLDAESSSFSEALASSPAPAPDDVATSHGKIVVLGRMSDAQADQQEEKTASEPAEEQQPAAEPASSKSWWERLGFGGSEGTQPAPAEETTKRNASGIILEPPVTTVAPFVPVDGAGGSSAAPASVPDAGKQEGKASTPASMDAQKNDEDKSSSRHMPHQRQFYLAY